MANTNRTAIKLTLDKERTLFYTLNSLEIIEEMLGKSLEEITESMRMRDLKVLVYAGLIWEDKTLTVDQVGDLIGFEDLGRVSEAVGKAFGGLK